MFVVLKPDTLKNIRLKPAKEAFDDENIEVL
jgi:hypothetical protein